MFVATSEEKNKKEESSLGSDPASHSVSSSYNVSLVSNNSIHEQQHSALPDLEVILEQARRHPNKWQNQQVGHEELAQRMHGEKLDGLQANLEQHIEPKRQQKNSGHMSDDNSDTADANSKKPRRSGRRFSIDERKLLFTIIKEDALLTHAFLHQVTKRIWDGKSWMHEIGKRFNNRAAEKRSNEAVRHHLKLRRKVRVNGQRVPPLEQEDIDFRNLLDHCCNCIRQDECARCLQLCRLRVKRQLAKCGYEECTSCDPKLPNVFDSGFEPRNLLNSRKAVSQKPDKAVNVGCRISTRSQPPSVTASSSSSSSSSALENTKATLTLDGKVAERPSTREMRKVPTVVTNGAELRLLEPHSPHFFPKSRQMNIGSVNSIESQHSINQRGESFHQKRPGTKRRLISSEAFQNHEKRARLEHN